MLNVASKCLPTGGTAAVTSRNSQCVSEGQHGEDRAKEEAAIMIVDYVAAARRHIRDAHLLQHAGNLPNAGQLFGICVECGLKSLLVLGGAPVDADGNLKKPFRQHFPELGMLINGMTTLPDGRAAGVLQSRLPSLASLANWKIAHRYWRESAIPVAISLQAWEGAAQEMDRLLDEEAAGGVL